MRQPARQNIKLPQRLLDELGIEDIDASRYRRRRDGPGARKIRRKAIRIQKKQKSAQPSSTHLKQGQITPSGSHSSIKEDPKAQSDVLRRPDAESGPKNAKPTTTFTLGREKQAGELSSSQLPRLSKGVRDKLAQDDAEIEALERALGVKGNKPLPKSFEEDGLNTLLEDFEKPEDSGELLLARRERMVGVEWLNNKRRNAIKIYGAPNKKEEYVDREEREPLVESHENHEASDLEDGESMISGEGENEHTSSVDNTENANRTSKSATKRDNPYVAPISSEKHLLKMYVPKSMRGPNIEDQGDSTSLRRQIQGLINRLSEANIITILGEIEHIYRENPRQHVSTILIDLLMSLLCDASSLQDTFIILHAGFIAAVYKTIGVDFGAQIVQRIAEEFERYNSPKTNAGGDGKKSINLISLLAELFNFRVISSILIYDLIRVFLEHISETNTELLLKIIKNSGSQLRQDDPSSIKDIIVLLHSAVAEVNPGKLSIRTQFMVETINSLRNNRMKTGLAASTIASEHTMQMKKILGSLNTRTINASEPLRIGLKDIRDTDKRGKWWLVGASYRDQGLSKEDVPMSSSVTRTTDRLDGPLDLLQLAKDNGMNTDIRRTVFVTIMSATDYRDAYSRLLKLRFKKSQQLQIPKVILHCASAEMVYNPYYTCISRLLCSDRRIRMAFQFSLWDIFKRLGEDIEDGAYDEQADELSLGSIVNLAKLFGVLVAEDVLGLSILKTLKPEYLRSKTRTFVELFFITLMIQTQKGSPAQRNENSLTKVFLKLKEAPESVPGLRYFLQRIVRKTDVAGSEAENATVKWGCKVADGILAAVASALAENGS